MKNRRSSPRINVEVPFRYLDGSPTPGGSVRGVSLDFSGEEGLTLNLSQTGARALVHRPLPQPFPIALQLDEEVTGTATRVWEQRLAGPARIVGLRFEPDTHARQAYFSWLARQGD